MELNPQQIEAVNNPAKNILLVACPGSGKTTVIIERIVRLIKEGVSPYEFLVIIFTRKAAQQLKERLGKAFEGTDVNVKKMTICTSHAFCLKVIRQWAEKIGYNENVVIYDEIDQKDIITEIIKENGYKISPTKAVEQIKEIITNPNALPDRDNEEIFILFRLYLHQLQKYNALDYDLILLKAVQLLKSWEVRREYYQNRYKYLFYDEFQDIAELENQLCLTMAIENSFVVGDVSQNIYSFRGTDIKYILDFPKTHSNSKILKLEYNYRSLPYICKAANNLIKHNTQRADTEIIPVKEPKFKEAILHIDNVEWEQGAIAEMGRLIRSWLTYGIKPQDIAILVRTNKQIERIRMQLDVMDIPVQVVAKNLFWQKPEIKDMLAFMRMTLNRKDEFSVMRILKMPFLGFTNKQILEIKQDAIKNDETLFNACRHKSIGNCFQPAFDTNNPPALKVYKDIVNRFGYIEWLMTQNLTTRVESVLSMEAMIEKFQEESDDISLNAFLESISLVSSINSWDEKKESVSLMTLHCSKGLEWDNVFIVGCMEGLIPLPCKNDIEAEEERRLFYVGITRAKEGLFLTRWNERELYGKIAITMPSRFSEEIKDNKDNSVVLEKLRAGGEIG